MKIVCASSVLSGEAAFRTLGDVVSVPEEEITPEIVRDADALMVRSRRRVDEALLSGSRVSFVGTATSGFDHLDVQFLDAAGIAWCAAPGCNANAVAEWCVTALLGLAVRHGLVLEDLTLGIVGVGHVGAALAQKALALDMKVLFNDPPRALAEGAHDFVDLDALLDASDVVSLHVPLTEAGPFRTRHLADHRFFERIRPGALLLNTSRGEVVDTDALLLAMERGTVLGAALDVWENEPAFRPDLLERVDFGTPHIAGHSLEGKLRGTMMVYEEACRFFELEPGSVAALDAPVPRSLLTSDGRARLEQDVLWDLASAAYPLAEDDRALRACADADADSRTAGFVQLRRDYRVRREFAAFDARLLHCEDGLARKVGSLGFRLMVGS